MREPSVRGAQSALGGLSSPVVQSMRIVQSVPVPAPLPGHSQLSRNDPAAATTGALAATAALTVHSMHSTDSVVLPTADLMQLSGNDPALGVLPTPGVRNTPEALLMLDVQDMQSVHITPDALPTPDVLSTPGVQSMQSVQIVAAGMGSVPSVQSMYIMPTPAAPLGLPSGADLSPGRSGDGAEPPLLGEMSREVLPDAGIGDGAETAGLAEPPLLGAETPLVLAHSPIPVQEASVPEAALILVPPITQSAPVSDPSQLIRGAKISG